MDTWNPSQYLKFQRDRVQPLRDLVALCQPAPDVGIVALGCGAGSLTRRLEDFTRRRQDATKRRAPKSTTDSIAGA